ncbi:MAG TPA: site-2 protease family protein [Candidatus Baltobacteraceae bacterium]|nr:site-2 protease family protein [Candidatus Baltobacteraceae bacterium]
MQVARAFGTPVRIDASWLFIFALLVWTLSSAQGPFAMATPHWRIAASVVTVIALFVCVVAHELAHVAVARSFGIHTVDIVLFAFGGVSRMEKVGATPAAEAQISVAGPALSLCLGIICALAAPIFPANSLAFGIVTYLAIINVALAAFNFLPAYPMDGGRLVHALAWRMTRDRMRATQLAVRVSTAAGALMGAAGLALLITGYVVDGVWIALLAWFIIRSAQTEYIADVQIGPLASVRCADLVDPPSRAFQPDMTSAQALAQMIGTRRRAVPISVGRRLLGIITLNDFAKLGTSDANYVYVSAIMTPVEQLQKLAPDLSGLEAFNELASSGHPQLPVVDQSGTLLGFVTRETLARNIEKAVK